MLQYTAIDMHGESKSGLFVSDEGWSGGMDPQCDETYTGPRIGATEPIVTPSYQQPAAPDEL